MSLNRKGISPFIASVLTILLGVLMLTLVLGVVNPIFNRVEDSSVITDAFQNLNLLNSVIKEVSSEAEGSKRTVSVSVSGGEYSINAATDSLVFTYDPSEHMYLTGRKGDIYIERGSVFLDFFNWYVEDSKADPVWTNTSGQWIVDNYKYKGNGGLAYHNLSTLENYKFSGDIYNSSGGTGGQIFVLPANPERLVGFWTFDNRTGSKAYDWSGNLNNGTLTDMNTTGNSTSGWQSYSDCKAGLSCLKFDGVNDYVKVSDSPSLNFSEITVALWVKSPSDQSPNIGLVVKANTFEVTIDTPNKIGAWVNRQGATYATYSSDNTVPNDQWTHVAFTYDGAHQRVYINGIESNNDPLTGAITNTTSPVSIGNSTQGYFNGIIDEVKIWNVSLSSDEIAAEYELSTKKVIESGSQSIGAKTPNAAIVLANPDGVTSFDNIKISRTNRKKQKLVIPYSNVDLNGTLRIVKGEHRVAVEHMGTNTTLSKPIIQITS